MRREVSKPRYRLTVDCVHLRSKCIFHFLSVQWLERTTVARTIPCGFMLRGQIEVAAVANDCTLSVHEVLVELLVRLRMTKYCYTLIAK